MEYLIIHELMCLDFLTRGVMTAAFPCVLINRHEKPVRLKLLTHRPINVQAIVKLPQWNKSY